MLSTTSSLEETPTKVETAQRLARLERLADLLDTRWRIPGTSLRFGLDGVASILPLAGDTATACVSGYLIWQSARLGASRMALLGMAANVALDWAVGSIPLLGTLFDVGFKANRRNMRLLRRHLERKAKS